jgi:hypothetical protein
MSDDGTIRSKPAEETLFIISEKVERPQEFAPSSLRVHMK